MNTEAPPWFTRAVQVPAQSHYTEHAGCRVHYRTWGEPDRPGVLLVHGGAAHSHWWDFIAPAFIDRYFVVAPDLSGHGESGRRDAYPPRTWVGELLAVMDHVGFAEKPALVGHSMGGLVSIVAAALHGQRFSGAVIVDAPVRPRDSDEARKSRVAAFRNPKVYPDREAALAAFRLIPVQPCAHDFIVEHIARHSLREVESGYTWKFDPAIVHRTVIEPMESHLANAQCPMALIVGAQSEVVTDETAAHMHSLLGGEAPLVRIEDAYHHVLLDQPQAFIAAVARLLEPWL